MISSHRIFNTMPTVVALDVSLSMSRPVLTEASEEYQRRHFAIHGIGTFLDVLSSSCKLEFVSLVGCVFSLVSWQFVNVHYFIVRVTFVQ